MNDFLTYYVMPAEQLMIDQLQRYRQIVQEYETINQKNQKVLEQMIKNQADIIAKHAEKLQYCNEYIEKISNNSINNYPFKDNNCNSNYKSKHASKKKISFQSNGGID